MKRPERNRSLQAMTRIVLAFALLGSQAFTARAEVIEEVAAFVNGQILTRSELLVREQQLNAQLARNFSGEDLASKISEARQNLLTDMIREILLLQRAEILGLDLERVYRQALDNLKGQQGIKTNDEMRSLLKQEGITEDELRRMLLRFNVPDIMINLEVRQKIAIPEDEIVKYFNEHQPEFRVEESFTIREIVLLSEDHTPEELRQKTEAFQADMAAGVPFAELVLKHSEAPSRFQEGMVGPLSGPDLAPELRSALADLAEGEVAGPINTAHGIHFMMLEKKTDASEPNLDNVRRGIEAKLKQERFAEELQDYWKLLYKENRIKVVDKYRNYAMEIPAS